MRQGDHAEQSYNHVICHENFLAREWQHSSSMTLLQAIETRQRRSAVRDLMFAAFIAVVAVVTISTVATALLAATSGR